MNYICINNYPLIVSNIKEVTDINPLHRYIRFEIDIDNLDNKENFKHIQNIRGYLTAIKCENDSDIKRFEKCFIKYDKLSLYNNIYIVQLSYVHWFSPTMCEIEKIIFLIKKLSRNIFINEILNNVRN